MASAGQPCRRTILYAGMVQGVGFRYTTERVARRFAVGGYVRNLPDGRVEVVAEGTPEEVGGFLMALEDAMKGYIEDRQITECPVTGEFRGFGVRY